MLQEKLKSYEEKEKNTPSLNYADAVKSNVGDPERKTNPPKVIIKPKAPQDGNKTKSDLNQTINLIDLKVGVKQIRMGKNGSVILSCQTKKKKKF
ncbi:hypothetical protein JTB14_036106 [Gonioctena quinquepunctata]|nr:hypothetical protein JTB14_036106 [Gonioctena quinquepunctata]